MKRLLILLLLVLACTPPPPPPVVTAPQPPPFLPAGTAQRVVLISYDGLGADRLPAQTNLPAFQWLAQDGMSARIVPVNPTLTATTHTTILTGVPAERHGIVSNRFHLPGTPQDKATLGMDIEPDAETLVDAAKRNGKRTGCIPFPTMDGKTPRRTCDFGLAWTMAVERAKTQTLTRAQWKREWVPPTWSQQPARHRSFSPILRARVDWAIPKTSTRRDVDFVAYDSTDDGTTNYDAIYVELGDDELPVDANGWFRVAARHGDELYGSWSKITAADPTLEKVTVYWGAISRNEAWPDSFEAIVNDEVGFWPGPPDNDADSDTFTQQLNRLAEFLTAIHVLAIRRMDADLLLLYQPAIDEAEHQHLTNPQVVGAAYKAADRSLAQLASLLDFSRDALLVTGDHGLGKIDNEVRMNRLLTEGGFAPRWRAFTSGSIAHIYRFAEPDDSDAVVAYLGRIPELERVEKKTPTSHRNAGDVVAYAFPVSAMSSSREAPAIAPADHPGQHGALNHHRMLHTLFFARGAGVGRATFGEVSQTKIARFVATLLGMTPPAGAE